MTIPLDKLVAVIKQDQASRSFPGVPPSLSPVARAMWIIGEAKGTDDEMFRKALARVFPRLTVGGVKDAGEECRVEHIAHIEKLDRKAESQQETMFEMQEIALETGIPLGPYTVIGEFLDAAIAQGNERAKRLSLKIEGTTITYRIPD